MDLKRWTHVIAVADRRSFARAAEQVHISQPALTRSIQAAEAELGLRLFDRGTQEVLPTAAGEFVITRARQLIFNSRCLERDVELYLNRTLGDTAFGVGPFPAATFLPSLLAGLRRDFPGVNLRVEVSNWQLLLTRLREEDIEFFVAETRDLPADPRIDVRPLRKEPGGTYVRAGHPLAARKAVTLRQVWEYGVATVRLPQGVRAVLARLLEAGSPSELRLALECDDVDVLKAVALACDTVLAAPHAAVAAELASRTLRPLTVSGLPPLFSSMGVVTLRGRTPSPMADLVIRRLPADGATRQ
ncbi:LysR family transcriptional regulator [Rivibacter subsaxonicus]|uniref:DNA-binding transcriptional LysR family regulator n=1 Tax=Rivibacter subsaxonicus TaxID=457575 RepID=A0A4Q7VG94_9BURK|nr:LysR family transcriptional regulator [Rivibacter subsaxonicus]RZT95046.1 DNA-binding transcriptional LysR family regulator [Rivibacter subsaxonicus]